MTDLKDTTEMMSSPDYKERFRAEYAQLQIRSNKLSNMLYRWDEGKLDFTPTCPRDLYDYQIKAMADYMKVLRIRAKIEGVSLSEFIPECES